MFGKKRANDGPVYGALIDIGSGTVGIGIVVSHAENALPELIYTHRIMMRVTEHAGNQDENLRKVREALLSAALILSQDGRNALAMLDPDAQISKLYVTCSSPWSYTIARNAHFSQDEQFRVTEAIINDLVKSAEDEIISHLKEHSLVTQEGFEVVEQATVDITVNEYPVVNPFNLKGKTLSLSHVIGLIPKEILKSIHEVEHKLFPNTEVRAHTYMLVMYCVLRDIFPRTRSLAIIDITGEATEFGIVENNLLIENSFTPHGSSTFLRDVMNQTGKPVTDIMTSLHTLGEESALLPDTFSSQVVTYQQHMVEALTRILERRTLPTQIIITAHPPFEKLFSQILHTAFTQVLGKEPEILHIDPKIVNEISHGADNDVYLALSARFFHKLHGCGELN